MTAPVAPAIELHHTYHPRGAARELLRCRADEVLLSGPVATGKSRACLEKLNLAALKYPNMRGLIVRQVRDTLSTSALKTLDEFVIKEQLEARTVVYCGATGRKPARYVYNNGSELWIAGMDKPSKIMSTEFDMIFVQEATELHLDAWESLTTRLGRRLKIPYQQLIADCNPDAATHWLKQRCDSGATLMLHSRHQDNPNHFASDGSPTPAGTAYMAKLDRLTGVRRARLRDGLWVAAEGVIWESYDPAVHDIFAFPVPQDWPRIWSVDFGMVHPFVLQCWAVDGDGRLYRYREIHMTGRLVEDHARQILGIVAPGGEWIEPKPQRILCDHDAEDRATLRRHLGLPNHPANKAVKPGLEAVEARFRDKRIFFMRGALVERDQTLVDARKPTCTEEEIGGYVWDDHKEQPIKEDDDGCDATRYVVAHYDLKTSGNILRWVS